MGQGTQFGAFLCASVVSDLFDDQGLAGTVEGHLLTA